MLVVRPSIALFLVAAAGAEATNLRQAHRSLQTYTPSDNYFSVMLDRVNHERTSRGLPALCTNHKLQAAAQRHSNDEAKNNYMGHDGTDGTNSAERISQAGYDWSAVAENVAAGQPDVDSVMEAWMNSPGHRANILGADYTMFGCAYAYNGDSTYKHYWTQDFGSGDNEHCDSGNTASEPATTVTKTIEAGVKTATHSAYETEAPCTDEPAVPQDTYSATTDAPSTTAPVNEYTPQEAGSEVTEAPCTDAPIVATSPAYSDEYSSHEAGSTDSEEPCSDESSDAGSNEYASHDAGSETDAPCTNAPVVEGSKAYTTDAPATDAPVVEGSKAYTTDAPATDAPAVEGSKAYTTDAPATNAPVVENAYNDEPHHEKDCATGF